jgi:hypothetical protein
MTHFSLTSLPDTRSQKYPLYSYSNNIYILNYDGTVLKQYPAPGINWLYEVVGTPVKLEPDKPDYYAALFNYWEGLSSVLCIYNPEGQLIYQEAFNENGGAIYVLHQGANNTEILLVGGYNKVWQYTLAEP